MVSRQVCTVALLLLCGFIPTHASVYQVSLQNSNRYKIDHLTDGNLQHALRSIAAPSNVKELDLSGNPLSRISANDLNAFTNLELLNLSSNVLFETVDLGSLPKLHTKLVLLNDIHFREAHTVDLRGNWLQCESLRKFLGIDKQPNKNANKNTRRYSNPVGEEPCNNQSEVKRVGIYCCDELSAPFADRLIDLKRKELALYSGQSTENDRKECELEKQARQRKINEVQTKYSTTINEDAKRQQQKIKLTNEKIVLEKSISETDLVITDLQNLLNETASNLQLDPSITNQGPLQLLRAIVQWYEEQYEKEQIVQNNAIRDFDRYQQTIEEKLEENTRLKKVNNDAEQALVAANQTNIMLEKREQDLAKILREAV
uniref:LRIM1/APL1C-like dimerization domain-containing protein n=1 Tax=Anopheles farauti TaxID=69004 RepID=A0A9I3GIP5_9DIPT